MSRSNKLKRKSRKSRQKSPTLSREFKLSIGIDPDKKSREEPVIKNDLGLPKTAEDLEAEKEQVIEDIFDGDLNKFLKRLYRVSNGKAIRVHSKMIPEWKKDKDKRRVIRWINKNLDWPKHKVEIVHLLRTLERYYDAEINKDNVILAYELWDLFSDEITNHFQKSWNEVIKRKGWGRIKRLSKADSLKEQLAIGYKHVNDFEDFDRKAAHVYSTAKKDYLYPENFYHSGDKFSKQGCYIYIAFPLVGISGFSRIDVPN